MNGYERAASGDGGVLLMVWLAVLQVGTLVIHDCNYKGDVGGGVGGGESSVDLY